MHYKTNRQNHDFQIAYFIAGACQTPDAAYGILKDLREDRSNAIKSFSAGKLREKAKIMKATKQLTDTDPVVVLEAQATIAEIEALAETSQANYDAAIAELAFIDLCIDKVQPLRKFSHLPDVEAHEAAQREEWKLKLIKQAEDHILVTGNVTPELFSTMRLHPDFETEIFPSVNTLKTLMGDVSLQKELVARITAKGFDLPKLLK